jgi:hypothetical protein
MREYDFVALPNTHEGRMALFNEAGTQGWVFKRVVIRGRGLEAIFERDKAWTLDGDGRTFDEVAKERSKTAP